VLVNGGLFGGMFLNRWLDLLKSNIIKSDLIALLLVQKKVSLHNYDFQLEYLRFFSIYIGLSDKLWLITYTKRYYGSIVMMNLPTIYIFLFAIGFTASDYSFGFFKLFYYSIPTAYRIVPIYIRNLQCTRYNSMW
jgi:hypothetical protein